MGFILTTKTKGILTCIFLVISITTFSAIANNIINNLMSVYAQGNASDTTISSAIPSAESIHTSERLELPPNVDVFVMLIVNEAHESWEEEPHKLITDKNAYYIPSNLVIHEGTKLAFLNADAPWDTPHPHNIELVNVEDNENSDYGEPVYTTGILDYTNSSEPVILPVGTYSIINIEYDTKEGTTITVLENSQSMNNSNSLVVGGFYTPTNQVENNRDNEGNPHPGSLAYYRQAFRENGFAILSEHNFSYATCDYCPGKYWPDNKAADHTLIIFGIAQPLEQAIEKLEQLVKDNVYV
jgi:hypothetical protein